MNAEPPFAELLAFWFERLQPGDWWRKSTELDRQIACRFTQLHRAASVCELYAWRESAAGALAEVLLLDQFSRHLYRDSPLAFASDPLALALAQQAIARGWDRELAPQRRGFLYMPFMHSESPEIHRLALALFDQPGLEASLAAERRHKTIIDRFGRYPHRNAVLGRESSDEELAFLQQPGSSF